MMTIMMITKIQKMMIMLMRKRMMMIVMVTIRWYGMCTDRKHSFVLHVNT
jgi:hypothetical protein